MSPGDVLGWLETEVWSSRVWFGLEVQLEFIRIWMVVIETVQ